MKKIYAVGIGPGAPELLTPQAQYILNNCTVIAGYKLYLDQISAFTQNKKLIPGAMRQEVERCRAALDATLAGETVAVISSGDAGIYGMAGLLLELCEEEVYHDIEVEVIPGISAAISCAALAGAPLMNDFAVISLSDLMTPKETIKQRLTALAAADIPVALYNPSSSKRHDLLEFAVEIFRRSGGALPGVIVRDAYRSQQMIKTFTLDEFPFELVQMTTLVIIGNSQTVRRGDKLYCCRGYKEKYGVGQ
jgi:precorrin-3B C17-methyltransferase